MKLFTNKNIDSKNNHSIKQRTLIDNMNNSFFTERIVKWNIDHTMKMTS